MKQDKKKSSSKHKMAEVPDELQSFREDLLNEIKSQIQSVHQEIQKDIAVLRKETKADLRALREELTKGGRGPTGLRIFGVAEGTEGLNPVRFVEKFFSQVLGAEHFDDSPVTIEQVSRTPTSKYKKHNQPRAIAVQLQSESEVKKILKLAKKKTRLLYKGDPVHIFSDVFSDDEGSGAMSKENGAVADSFNTQEQAHACHWIQNNLEEYPEAKLPKEVVYDSYRKECKTQKLTALSGSCFGKIMRDVLPKMQARRLGGRGQSKYYYCGVRRKTKSQNEDDTSDEDEPVKKKKAGADSDEDEPVKEKEAGAESDEDEPVKKKSGADSDEDEPVKDKKKKKAGAESGEDEPVKKKQKKKAAESDEDEPVKKKQKKKAGADSEEEEGED